MGDVLWIDRTTKIPRAPLSQRLGGRAGVAPRLYLRELYFAKLVELFDAHGVSFISVTQAFNTTTSMGRLTLNMLLSFAQFEREITGERIRSWAAAVSPTMKSQRDTRRATPAPHRLHHRVTSGRDNPATS